MKKSSGENKHQETGERSFEKKTTVQNKIVFITQKYLSRYMRHCEEERIIKRKYTAMFMTVHIFPTP